MVNESSAEQHRPTAASSRQGIGPHGCAPIILDFYQLTQNRNECFIRLDGETYRLQLTRNHKLILTK